MNTTTIFSTARTGKLRKVVSWVLLLALLVGLFPQTAVRAEAAETMYGIWCSTCRKYVDEFTGTCLTNNFMNQDVDIACRFCDNGLISFRFDFDSYTGTDDDGNDYGYGHSIYSIEKLNNTVTFPIVTAKNEWDDTGDDYSGSSTGNIITDYYDAKTLVQTLHNSVMRKIYEGTGKTYMTIRAGDSATFTWTEWYDSGKEEYSTGTVYHGLSEYLSAFGIEAMRVDSYSIGYEGNGADSGSMAGVTVKGGESTKLAANTFTKTGYTFAGWATTPNGSVEYADKASITPTSNLTLYAVWKAGSYDVTCIDMDSAHNVELGRTTVQKTYGASVKGSDFGADKTVGAYYAGYAFTVGTSATVSVDAASNIIYRYFEPQSYSITLVDMVLDEDTVLGTDSSMSKLAGDTARGTDWGTASPYQGYTFNSDTSATVSADGTTVYRYFTRNNYTVAYVDVVAGDGGKELGRTSVDKGYDIAVSGADIGTDATVSAYYPGYYYNGNSSTSVVSVDGATVYRYFEPASYDITYISVVGDIAGRELGREVKPGAGVFDTVVSGDALGTDTTEGAYFPGYTYMAATQSTVTTDGAVVYRIFKAASYSLSLELNGGTLDDPMDSYEFGAYVELPNVYRIGYSFKGWYDNAEFAGEPVTAIETGSTGAKTYYACWSNDNYSINMQYAGTGNSISVSRDGVPVEDGTIHYGDIVTVNFGADAGRKLNGYSITETVTDAADAGNGIAFTMPNSDVNITTYWLECTELTAGTNAAFDAVYKVEPYWNGSVFNVDAQPAITITPDMLSVFARIYDTQTQTWSDTPVDVATVSFLGSNVLSDINNTVFTVQSDIFGDGYNQQGTFSLNGESAALNNAMQNSNSSTYGELEGYLDTLQSDILLYEDLVIDLQTKLNLSNELKEEYAQKISALTDELTQAQNDYKTAQEANAARIAELQSELQTITGEYNQTVEGLTGQIADIEAKLTEEGADVETLTAERDALNAQLAEVISSYNAKQSTLQGELDSLNGEIQGYKDNVDALLSELDTTKATYEAEIASLEEELNTIRTETDALLAKIEAMENTIKEILGRDDIDFNGSYDDMQKILDELKNKVDTLDSTNSSLITQIEEKEKEIEKLDGQIDSLKDKVESLKDKSNSASNNNSELWELTDDLKSENDQLVDFNRELSSEVSALEAQKATLQNELNTLRAQLSTLQSQIVTLTTERDSLQAQLTAKEAEYQTKLAQKDAEIQARDVTIANLQAQIATLEKQATQAVVPTVTPVVPTVTPAVHTAQVSDVNTVEKLDMSYAEVETEPETASVEDIDRFLLAMEEPEDFSGEIKVDEPEEKAKNGTGAALIIAAIVVTLAAAGGGAAYYFIVKKRQGVELELDDEDDEDNAPVIPDSELL